MSQLIITKSALMHIESRIGDGAECEVFIDSSATTITIIYKEKHFSRSFSYSGLHNDTARSGEILSQFEKEAIAFFTSSE